jgi:PH (Pleckstrin Homology) domain-containing protein
MNAWDDQRVVGWAICAFLFCGFFFFTKWQRRLLTEIAVTDRRIIYKTGEWTGSRSTDEVNLEAIRGVSLRQNTFDRWFDYGYVIVDDGSWSGSGFCIDSPLAMGATMTQSGGGHA